MLIDANALFMSDMPGAAIVLDRIYRQSYSFDSRNSASCRRARLPDMATFDVTAHYSLSRPASPAAARRRPVGCRRRSPTCAACSSASTTRSRKLPEQPMRPRVADERIGYFTTERARLHQRYAARAACSASSIAGASRRRIRPPSSPSRSSRSSSGSTATSRRSTAQPIRDGILEWNKAFERIGFKDAIRVEVQPDDADFDTSDLRHASVRWHDRRAHVVRRDRPVGDRSAHRRDPRRRHRHRREQRRASCAT